MLRSSPIHVCVSQKSKIAGFNSTFGLQAVKMSGSDSSDENKNLPSAAECDQRCKEFAQITGTDTALAMLYLQDRDWDLQIEERGSVAGDTVDGAGPLPTNIAAGFKLSNKKTFRFEPYRIRLMSWNIDGLDIQNVRSRTLGVCDTINKENPHAVFLQEVVPQSEDILQDRCPTYHMIPGNDEGYFTMMMLKIGVVQLEESRILPYPNTKMMRNLLTAKCTIKGEKFALMTSHLESTKEHSAERKKQLKHAFSHMAKVDKDRTVVFGGDLNLRDQEVVDVGGIPDGAYDVWEITGKRPEAQFTWDIQRNDNLEWSFKSKPKCRFDRLYIRHSEPKLVKAEYFELIGLERLTSCQRFCSDHWGLLTHLNILSKLPK